LGFGPTSAKFGPDDVLGSNVRMPAGVPLAFMGLDEAGAKNAALEAIRILALHDQDLRTRLIAFIDHQTETVPYAAHD
jgi:5-(carboxyamino)imidazole ribonucleotide mutase